MEKIVWKGFVLLFVLLLREHEKNTIDFEKEKMLPLTKKLKSYQDAKMCYICGRKVLKKFAKGKTTIEVQHIVL